MKVNYIKLFSFPLIAGIFLLATFFSLKYEHFGSAEEFKCLKCHKGKDNLEKYVKEKNITSASDLRTLVRKGPKAGLHITSSDEDIEKAIKYLGLP